MSDITCGALRKWLEKQSDDTKIRFALNGPDNTQEFVSFEECFPTAGAYWIALRKEED